MELFQLIPLGVMTLAGTLANAKQVSRFYTETKCMASVSSPERKVRRPCRWPDAMGRFLLPCAVQIPGQELPWTLSLESTSVELRLTTR